MMDTLQRRRTLTGLCLAIGAFVLGLVAQGYLVRGFLPTLTPVDGLIVYALAALLLGIAVLRTPLAPGLPVRMGGMGRGEETPRAAGVSMANPGPDTEHRADTEHRDDGLYRPDVLSFTLLALLVCLAGAAAALALLLFGHDLASPLSWLLYLSSIWLFIGILLLLVPGRRAKARAAEGLTVAQDRPWTRREWIALLVILAIGAFLRLYLFAELPYGLWYDEADNGLWARKILTDPQYRPLYVPSTNLPAHFLYLVAFSFRLLGDSMHSIRAVAVAFGLLTIIAAHFCGRELGGPYFGLAMAFLLAVSRWDINWSRIGMHGVTVPFFELWIVAALLRGLRTGRRSAFGWAGIAMGLGLCFYSPLRVFPVVLAGFALAWLIRWGILAWRESPSRRGWGFVRYVLATWEMPVLLFVLGVAFAVAPVAQFSIQHRDLFWDRAKNVSLFKDPDKWAHPVQAVLDNSIKHLLMFNYSGDPNGRHNLPRAPMLDRLSGVLFVMGIVICAIRWRSPRSVLLLLWLLAPLSGGILTTWFEAPQSLRAIGSLPAACAMVCVPLEWFSSEWRSVFSAPLGSRRLLPIAVLMLATIGLENAWIYFGVWGRDFSSWAAFNAAETHLARDIQAYREDYDLRFDPLLTAHLATRYLAPDYEVYHHFDPATVFPIRGTGKSGVVLFIAPDTYPVRTQAMELYPAVRVEQFAHPYSGNIVLHTFILERSSIDATQGLDAIYAASTAGDAAGSQHEVVQRVERRLDLSWGDQPPVPYPFEALWRGGLLAPQYGEYTLHLDAPGPFLVELDGRQVLSSAGPASRQIAMAQGVHALYIEGQVTQPGAVRLTWQMPGGSSLSLVPHDALYRPSWPVRGLVGRYFANDSWSGEPQIVRIDRQVGYYFHFLPLPRPYTVEWVGRLAVPTPGVYHLSVDAVSSASLYIDEWLAIERATLDQPGEVELYLESGLHDIRLRYLDDKDHSRVYLYWQVPEGKRELIPSEFLRLPEEGVWWPLEGIQARPAG